MRGSRPTTHPSQRVGHRRQPTLTQVPSGTTRVPTAPTGLTPRVHRLWRILWKSAAASTWDAAADLPALTRYFRNLDRWMGHEEIVRKAPVVRGSKGQLRANPLANRMDALDGSLRAIEEQFGLTPLGRMRLGLEVIKRPDLRAQLQRLIDATDDEDTEYESEDDELPYRPL
jgi:P27 family predicted phage terminase small subunit